MHRPAISSAFACFLFVLAGCDAGAGTSAGAKLFASQGCTLCHGSDGAGTTLGPTLQGKKGFWTREKLVEYLKNPIPYVEKDKRLSDQARKFTLPMARFDKLSPEDLSALADHILSMP